MDRSTKTRARRRLGGFVLLALAVMPGCGRVRQTVAGVFGGSGPGVVDAHAVYRVRPGCATVAARTVQHGYSILTPAVAPVPAVAEAGLFEGPALVGTFVFRYVPPAVGETWDAARADSATVETRVAVAAVDLDLPDVRVWLDRLCGPIPPGEGAPGEAIPRIPGQ
ncbi:MAG TPA: hypothetical protein VGB53_08540 [Rubricoccaceae bacterium]|jgi:dienelactone hydrolase